MRVAILIRILDQDIFESRRASLSESAEFDDILLDIDGPKNMDDVIVASGAGKQRSVSGGPFVCKAKEVWRQHLGIRFRVSSCSKQR
jgi:hypothetical protein